MLINSDWLRDARLDFSQLPSLSSNLQNYLGRPKFKSSVTLVNIANWCSLPPVGVFNRELQILRLVRLRLRDFLNTKQCTRVSQRHFGGKSWQYGHSTTSFRANVVVAKTGYHILKVLSFAIGRARKTSFTKNNNANFYRLVKSGKMKPSGKSTF